MLSRGKLLVKKALELQTNVFSDSNDQDKDPLADGDILDPTSESSCDKYDNSLKNNPSQCNVRGSDLECSSDQDEDPFANEDDSDEYIPHPNDVSSSDNTDSEIEKEETVTEDEAIERTDKAKMDVEDEIVNENELQLLENPTVVKKKKIFNSVEKTTRKRQRNPAKWKRQKAALAREMGEDYINQKGTVIPAKAPNLGLLCTEKCKLKCSDKFTEEQRINIFRSFYKLDKNAKNSVIFKSMIIKTPRRPSITAKKHKFATFKYTVTCDCNNILVCKKAFCSLYQIGTKKVEYQQEQLKNGQSAPRRDRRGLHENRPSKLDRDVKIFIINHIKSFPAESSHYSRNKNPHKLYLSPFLNISKMYKLYLDECLEKNMPRDYKIKYCTYAKKFSTEFNLSFGEPKSDTCSTCDAGDSNEEHQENYRAAFQLQRSDRDRAKEIKGIAYITVDLQQTMPLPRLTTSKAFYLRQMWFYNLGIHRISEHFESANFFTWTEDVAHRGSSEVCSSLLTFIELDPRMQSISHMIVWSDSCAGQNKNFLIICLYQLLILRGKIKKIDHKFPEVGHSFLDSDRDFGRIEKVLRKQENVYLPEQYRAIINDSSKLNFVTDMSAHFRDLENLMSNLKLYNRKKNVLNETVPFRDGIKWIRVEEYGSYLYKECYDENTPFKKVNILRNIKSNIIPELINVARIGKKTGKLSEEKILNLIQQLQYVPEEYQWYYKNVIAQNPKD